MTCYPSSTSLCWVCGLEECPHGEKEEPKQLSLFEVENLHKCGNCAHLLGGICAIKSHEAGQDIRRDGSAASCYAFTRRHD
jgi:hypothetical protein